MEGWGKEWLLLSFGNVELFLCPVKMIASSWSRCPDWRSSPSWTSLLTTSPTSPELCSKRYAVQIKLHLHTTNIFSSLSMTFLKPQSQSYVSGFTGLVFFPPASHGLGQDSGRLPNRLQELPEQHREEAGPAGDGEPFLRTQDGAGQTKSETNAIADLNSGCISWWQDSSIVWGSNHGGPSQGRAGTKKWPGTLGPRPARSRPWSHMFFFKDWNNTDKNTKLLIVKYKYNTNKCAIWKNVLW